MTASEAKYEPTTDELRAEIRELGHTASFEILPNICLNWLPQVNSGTRIHITDFSTSTRDVRREQTISLCREFLQKRFIPVPHIAARRVQNRDELELMTSRMATIGTSHVMLIAGDGEPAGDFKCVTDLLDTRLMEKFNNVAVAGHPEAGKRTVPTASEAENALRWKNRYAAMSNQNMRIITQLIYDPERLLEWTGALGPQKIKMPVHVGMTGPASFQEKVKYAKLCGIDVTKFVKNQGGTLFKLFSDQVPDQMITAIADSRLKARHQGLTGIAGLHFFTFGVPQRTVGFVNSLKEGHFVMNPENTGFKLEYEPA